MGGDRDARNRARRPQAARAAKRKRGGRDDPSPSAASDRQERALAGAGLDRAFRRPLGGRGRSGVHRGGVLANPPRRRSSEPKDYPRRQRARRAMRAGSRIVALGRVGAPPIAIVPRRALSIAQATMLAAQRAYSSWVASRNVGRAPAGLSTIVTVEAP